MCSKWTYIAKYNFSMAQMLQFISYLSIFTHFSAVYLSNGTVLPKYVWAKCSPPTPDKKTTKKWHLHAK